MSNPQLSVAMSVFNDAAFVGEAIDSILGQSFGDFEFIIVNDGSTDGSGEIINARAASDPRIRVIHQPNRGFIASLNLMFQEARAPWIARMDGDDVCPPHRFARQMDFIRANPGYGVVGCLANRIDPTGKPIDFVEMDAPLTHEQIYAGLEDKPLINHNAAMILRQPVLDLGGYRPAFRHCEDYDLWLRLIDHVRFANIPEALVSYRIYPEQVSNSHLVEQASNAAIAWQTRIERLAGRADPTEGLSTLPELSALDALFGRTGVAAAVRRRVVNRILYSSEALSGEGYRLALDHIAETGGDTRLWRACARMLKTGRAAKAAGIAHALLKAG